ncbi:MAG: hypothetical protein P8015_06600 [Acidihalobacter sp.]
MRGDSVVTSLSCWRPTPHLGMAVCRARRATLGGAAAADQVVEAGRDGMRLALAFQDGHGPDLACLIHVVGHILAQERDEVLFEAARTDVKKLVGHALGVEASAHFAPPA